MTEKRWLEFLRNAAESWSRVLSGVDSKTARELAHESVKQFCRWWDDHHQSENAIALADPDADLKEVPNPINWPTPEGRKAFAGDRRLPCYVATWIAVHDENKDPCVDMPKWAMLRALLYKFIREKNPLAGYDRSVLAEAMRCVRAHLAGGQRSEAAPGPAGADLSDQEDAKMRLCPHPPDFRSVNWFGQEYSFTASQAACIKTWWQYWRTPARDVGDAIVLEAAGCASNRVSDVFKHNSAWGEMIVEGDTRGTHRLREPNEPKKPASKPKRTRSDRPRKK